jgi:DNA-binding transcriptional MerR regulator
MMNIYLLKDLAKISGHSTHTLKYYLRLDLIQEIGRSPETNFRYFDDSSLEQLKEIRALQKQDYSLKEIHQKLNEKEDGKKD